MLSWAEDPVPIQPMTDTTPPQSYFDKVQRENAKAISISNNNLSMDGRGVVVDFDTIFSVWFKMDPSQKKEKIGMSLRASLHFEQLLKEHEAKASESKGIGAAMQSPRQIKPTPPNISNQI